MGAPRIPARVRATVAVLLGSACALFGVGIVTAQIPLAVAWGDSASPATMANAASLAPPPLVVPVGPDEWFRPGGRNAGTEGLIDFLAKLALHDNAPLYVSETWGRAWGGANSDHHASRTDSRALDEAVLGVQSPTAATETAAQRIASALGVAKWSGGDLTRTINGYRFQVLWKVPGHFDHVHVGVRKV